MLVLPKFQPFSFNSEQPFYQIFQSSETTLPIYYEFHVMSPVVGLNYNLLYSAQNFQEVLCKKVLVTGNTCWNLFFSKVAGLQASGFLYVNFTKLMTKLILQNICEQLPLTFSWLEILLTKQENLFRSQTKISKFLW